VEPNCTFAYCGVTLTMIGGVGVGVAVGVVPLLNVKPGETEPDGPGLMTKTTGLPLWLQVPLAVNCVAET
jgi:hypothetical protein